jgi:predicted Zn-dependent protease
LLYGSKQYADARDAILHLTGLNPGAGPAWGLLGLCESETGDYAAALEHIQKGLSLNAASQPGLGDALTSREAMLLTRNGQFVKAFDEYSQFIRAGAPSESLVTALGLAALHRPLLPSEIPAGQQDLIDQAGRASVAMISGSAQSAEASLRQLAAAFPSEPGVHYLYASWLIKTNEQLATDELNRELSIAPGNADAHQMLAWILLMHGNDASALLQAEKAVEAEPDSSVAQLVLGRALADTGHLQDGLKHIEKSASLDPHNLEILISLASAYGQAGLYKDAMDERREALRLKEAAHGERN